MCTIYTFEWEGTVGQNIDKTADSLLRRLPFAAAVAVG